MVREVAAVARQTGLRDFTLLDVATGSADIPLAIVGWARGQGLRPRAMGGDLTGRCWWRRGNRWHTSRRGTVDLVRLDAFRAPFGAASVDIVTCSLACTLRAGRRNRGAARTRQNRRPCADHQRLRALAPRLPRGAGAPRTLPQPDDANDGLLSVLRAYTRDELAALARAAGLPGARVRRRFPFRLVLVWSPLGADVSAPD